MNEGSGGRDLVVVEGRVRALRAEGIVGTGGLVLSLRVGVGLVRDLDMVLERTKDGAVDLGRTAAVEGTGARGAGGGFRNRGSSSDSSAVVLALSLPCQK